MAIGKGKITRNDLNNIKRLSNQGKPLNKVAKLYGFENEKFFKEALLSLRKGKVNTKNLVDSILRKFDLNSRMAATNEAEVAIEKTVNYEKLLEEEEVVNDDEISSEDRIADGDLHECDLEVTSNVSYGKEKKEEEVMDRMKKLQEELEAKRKELSEKENKKNELQVQKDALETFVLEAGEILAALKVKYEECKKKASQYEFVKTEYLGVCTEMDSVKESIEELEQKIKAEAPIQLVFSGILPEGEWIDATEITVEKQDLVKVMMFLLEGDCAEQAYVAELKIISENICRIESVKKDQHSLNCYFEKGNDIVVKCLEEYFKNDESIKFIITD